MMPNKAISVSLAKIDYDFGEPYIHLIASAPNGFAFTYMHITICTPNKPETYWNIVDDNISDQLDLMIRIRLSDFFEDKYEPSIFKVTLKVEPIDQNNIEEVLARELWLSDVHGIYRYLIDSLMNTDECAGISDDLILKYLLLYGHQQALTEQDYEIASLFFKLMHDGFSKCGNSSRSGSNCGCHDRR